MIAKVKALMMLKFQKYKSKTLKNALYKLDHFIFMFSMFAFHPSSVHLITPIGIYIAIIVINKPMEKMHHLSIITTY